MDSYLKKLIKLFSEFSVSQIEDDGGKLLKDAFGKDVYKKIFCLSKKKRQALSAKKKRGFAEYKENYYLIVELKTQLEVSSEGESEFTLPARKLLDICKALPEGAKISFNIDGERALLRSGKSRFSLGLLPAQDFPTIESTASTEVLSLEEGLLRELINDTYFAMAQQDGDHSVLKTCDRQIPVRVLVEIGDRHPRRTVSNSIV